MNTGSRIRFGVLTLIVGCLLGIIGLLMRGHVPLPNVDVDAWATAVTQRNYFLAQVLGIIAYVLPFFGFWSLYAYLSKTENLEKIAYWGFMSSLIGTSLALPTMGIFSFVSPYLAQRYLQGDSSLPEIISQVAMGQPAIVNISGGTIYLLGTVLLGVAIWRSHRLPKWTGVLMALHGLLLVFGFALFPVLIVSWVFLLGCGVWVYLGMEKDAA